MLNRGVSNFYKYIKFVYDLISSVMCASLKIYFIDEMSF